MANVHNTFSGDEQKVFKKATKNFFDASDKHFQETYNEFLVILNSILKNPNINKASYCKKWVTSAKDISKLKAIDDYLKSDVCLYDLNAAIFLNWLNGCNASSTTFSVMEKIVTTPVIKKVFNEILDDVKMPEVNSSYINNIEDNKTLFKNLLEIKSNEEKVLFNEFYNEQIIMGGAFKIKAILNQKNFKRANNINMVLQTDSTYDQTLLAQVINNNIEGINELSDASFDTLIFALLSSKKMLNVYQYYYDLNHKQEKQKKKK